jgi:hypothetical protein
VSFIVDLHVHTKVGSGDSRIGPHDLSRHAGLHGIVLAEHLRRWSGAELEAHQGDGAILLGGRECETPYGHIIVLGAPDEAIAPARTAEELRSAVLAEGGLMILAHPFRHFPSSWNLLFPRSHDHWGPAQLAEWPPERLAGHPAFGLVDAVEVLNSGCTPRQNALARDVATLLRLPAIGASDAHDASFIGYYATAFDEPLRDDRDLIAAVKAGRCRPVARAGNGYVDGSNASPARVLG